MARAALIVAAAWTFIPCAASAAGDVRIAAAASFREALTEILAEHDRATGTKTTVIYGATGNLMRQILQGAPMHLFLAADVESAVRVADAGLAIVPPETLVRGHISLIIHPSSKIAIGPDLQGIADAVSAKTMRRFAIANPEIAPYGRAAREALEKRGLLGGMVPLLVYGENVGQVAQYVATGAAEAGITARSLTAVEPLASQVKVIDLPDDLHAPINQAMVVLKSAPESALKLAQYLKSGPSYAIFQRHGFSRP